MPFTLAEIDIEPVVWGVVILGACVGAFYLWLKFKGGKGSGG